MDRRWGAAARGALPSFAPERRSRTRGFRAFWIVIAVLFMVGGGLGSVLASTNVAAQTAATSQKSFDQSAADITSTLQLAIEQQNDLVFNAGAYVVGNPDGSQSDFLRWMNATQILDRYADLEGIGLVAIVPAADLSSYAAQAVADPPAPLSSPGTFVVTPPGPRQFYCLTALASFRSGSIATPPEVDVCATALGPALLAVRDAGVGTYTPYAARQQTWLGVEIPVYSGGTTPTSIAARRSAFIGWVGLIINPTVMLDRSLQAHPDLEVALRYHQGGSDVTFTAGDSSSSSHMHSEPLAYGWSVTTWGTVTGDSVFADGTALWVLLAGLAVSLLVGVLIVVLATGRERAWRLVTQRTSELRHQALHDALTGLPNRALLMDRLEQLLVRSRRSGTTGAVFYMDLDNFKNVNDTLGHPAGDQLLVAVAERLAGGLREADTVARMGGDEFVVLIDGATLDVAPELVAERLLDLMRQPFEIAGGPVALIVHISIGIAAGDRGTPEDLLRDADVALYQAKTLGKNRYVLFETAMQSTLSRRTDLEFELRWALAAEQYRLVYQPIYTTGDLAVIGVEALLRWDHPSLGAISPDEFVPILEETGQIQEVGRWVLLTACAQLAAWHSIGYQLSMSVNVSGRQLDNDTILGDIRAALDASGLDPHRLVLEITETALVRNPDATARRLRAIKDLGVRIAVDDFGTGYSSLAYLSQFPVDCLKIDRAFITAATKSPESKALIRTIVRLGKDLGLTTLAEGVESRHELALLRGVKVDLAQGFLLSKPLEASELEAQVLVPMRSRPPAQGVGAEPAATSPR